MIKILCALILMTVFAQPARMFFMRPNTKNVWVTSDKRMAKIFAEWGFKPLSAAQGEKYLQAGQVVNATRCKGAPGKAEMLRAPSGHYILIATNPCELSRAKMLGFTPYEPINYGSMEDGRMIPWAWF